MTRRRGAVLLALALFLATAFAGRDARPSAAAAESGALPPDPEDWVCRETAPVTPEAIEAWCRANPFRGLPAPAALSSPPPLGDLLRKNLFDLAFQAFLRRRAYATDLRWRRDREWRLTGPYVGPIGSGENYGVHPAVRIYYYLTSHLDVNAVMDEQGHPALRGWKLLIGSSQTRPVE